MQCTVLLASCHPFYPDPAAVLAQLLEDPPQQAQQAQLEELPGGSEGMEE